MCVSFSAFVTTCCLFVPKLNVIIFHPEKNVRKLTMNSATYRRPFKPAIPQATASAEGRICAPATASATYNGYGGAQTDCGSAGLISNTASQVVNMGECLANCCCHPINWLTSFKPGTWPRRIRQEVANCCSLGELGQLTELELSRMSRDDGVIATAPIDDKTNDDA